MSPCSVLTDCGTVVIYMIGTDGAEANSIASQEWVEEVKGV